MNKGKFTDVEGFFNDPDNYVMMDREEFDRLRKFDSSDTKIDDVPIVQCLNYENVNQTPNT